MDDEQPKPRGEPDKRHRDDWLLLAILTAADLEAAEAMWRQHVPPNEAGMLSGKGGWTFDPQSQEFVSRTGRILDNHDLKRVSLSFARQVEHDLRADASRMASGELDISDWQNRAADDVRDEYLCLLALGLGGFDRITKESLVKLAGSPDKPGSLAFSLDRLRTFAALSAIGEAGDEQAIIRRSGLYSLAGQAVYEQAKRQSHVEAVDEDGRKLFIYERNILGDPKTIHCPECPALTDLGWVDVGTLPLPGLRVCAMLCYCSLEFSLVGSPTI